MKSRQRKPDHRRTVALTLTEASVLPSGLNATLVTGPVLLVSGKPRRVWVATSHSRTVAVSLADASMRPSGLNATLVTGAKLVPGARLLTGPVVPVRGPPSRRGCAGSVTSHNNNVSKV